MFIPNEDKVAEVEIGFFCCNTRDPKKYVDAGFAIGPVIATRFLSAEEIESEGFVGIWTRKDDNDAKGKYEAFSGFPLPDKNNQNLFLIDYELA